MSAPATPATGPVSPSAAQVWRAARVPVAIALALVAVAVATAVVRSGGRAGYLDPEGVDDAGSHALAALLAERGVTVETARTARDARVAAGAHTLLVVVRPWLLSRRQLRGLAAVPGNRMLVEPTGQALDALAPTVSTDNNAPVAPRPPGCGLSAARRAGTADTGGDLYDVHAHGGTKVTRCYEAQGKPSVVRLVDTNGRATTILGTGDPLTNAKLGAQGDAALAMNLVGSRSKVVWLVPETQQPAATGQDGSLLGLLPDGVVFGAVQLAFAVVFVALWRVRRLGPVVAEPLPVAVRASETVEGRGRLYRSRHARDRAAGALRAGWLARVVPRLGLPRDATPQAVVDAVASRADRPATGVRALLYGAYPEDDAGLVRLADDLDTLETEVRRS
ncbi:MAG: DUF4350 domain-containing protein [Streptosporangiaceae bacterium]